MALEPDVKMVNGPTRSVSVLRDRSLGRTEKTGSFGMCGAAKDISPNSDRRKMKLLPFDSSR